VNQKHVADLVVALLAVNSYPATLAWALLPRLRAAHLLDPAEVARKEAVDLVDGLRRAGYDRGGITDIVGPRLHALMVRIRAGGLDALDAAVAADDKSAARDLLLDVPGVGPRVFETAWLLLTSDTAE